MIDVFKDKIIKNSWRYYKRGTRKKINKLKTDTEVFVLDNFYPKGVSPTSGILDGLFDFEMDVIVSTSRSCVRNSNVKSVKVAPWVVDVLIDSVVYSEELKEGK